MTESETVAVSIFRGQAASALDGKGRFSLPVNFRNVLALMSDDAGTVQLRADPERPYLTLFGDHVLTDYLGEIKRDADAAAEHGRPFDREMRENKLFGPIEEASIDTGGRFTVPQKMRTHYGISDVLFMVGSGRMIHLWAPDRFLAWSEANPMHKADCEQFLADLAAKRKGKA